MKQPVISNAKAKVDADLLLGADLDVPIFQLNILGMEWDIRLIDGETLQKIYGVELMGCTVYSHYLVDLRYDVSMKILEATFWHEISHAMTAHSIGSKEESAQLIDQELLANCIGDGLYQLMRQDFPFHPKYNQKQKDKKIKELLEGYDD